MVAGICMIRRDFWYAYAHPYLKYGGTEEGRHFVSKESTAYTIKFLRLGQLKRDMYGTGYTAVTHVVRLESLIAGEAYGRILNWNRFWGGELV
jgi:hypothetical protein